MRRKISTHAPLARCDQIDRGKWLNGEFQLTHLLRGATKFSYVFGATNNFNSRTSCEVRHLPQCCILDDWQFQLTHLLRGATNIGWISEKYLEISTHAPLARCDNRPFKNTLRLLISTHAPLARCDLLLNYVKNLNEFQLTHLLRGAT